MGKLLFLAILIGLIWYNLNKATIKGKLGEKQVAFLLNTLNPTEYIVINDLYLPRKGGKTTQIDHVLIAENGIYIIETKNFKGWITGSEHQQFWTQTNFKRKDKFYNPIWQNAGHIKAVQSILGHVLEDVPIYSVIAFGNQAELKFKHPFKNATVLKTNKLLSFIKSGAGVKHLSDFKKHKIKHLLMQYVLKDRKAQKQQSKKHVEEIKNDLNTVNNICPNCGSPLVKRYGKQGTFKGCSSYPSCKFTTE